MAHRPNRTAIRAIRWNRQIYWKMTTSPLHQTRKQIGLAAAAALCCSYLSAAVTPEPDTHILERTVGYQLGTPPRHVEWKSPEPTQSNLTVYSASLPPFDATVMQRVADHFRVRGDIKQFTDRDASAFGYLIEERNPTNRMAARDVAYIATTGAFRYGTADRGDRWDIKNHKPLVHGVPDKVEATRMAIELFPLLGISTNDLHHRPDGCLFTSSGEEGVTYNERGTKERKRVVIQRSISFHQRIPGAGVTSNVGDGGQVRFTFVSEGKVAGIEWFFRKLEPAGLAKPKSRQELINNIKSGRCWTRDQKAPRSLTVTNCELAYPQANSGTYQPYVWPFYMVTGVGDDGRRVTLFIPAEW
jgi:hypothetical protein